MSEVLLEIERMRERLRRLEAMALLGIEKLPEVSQKPLDPAEQASQKPETDPKETQNVSQPDVAVECTQKKHPDAPPGTLSIPPRGSPQAQQPTALPPLAEAGVDNRELIERLQRLWPPRRMPSSIKYAVAMRGWEAVAASVRPGESLPEFKARVEEGNRARYSAEAWASKIPDHAVRSIDVGAGWMRSRMGDISRRFG
jgi:hypothetical protein